MAARVAWQPQPERLKTGAQACRVLRLRGLVAGQTEDHPKATCQGMKQPTLPRVTPGPTSLRRSPPRRDLLRLIGRTWLGLRSRFAASQVGGQMHDHP